MSSDNQFDFQQARLRHISFKSRLRSALYGVPSDQESITSEFSCSLGKWIHGHALKHYSYIPEMKELDKVHTQMHVVARELLDQYHSGQGERAQAGLSRIEAIATELVGLLDIIEKKSQQ